MFFFFKSIFQAPDIPTLNSQFQESIENMEDPNMVTELYYCGSLEKPSRLQQILKEGFKDEGVFY